MKNGLKPIGFSAPGCYNVVFIGAYMLEIKMSRFKLKVPYVPAGDTLLEHKYASSECTILYGGK